MAWCTFALIGVKLESNKGMAQESSKNQTLGMSLNLCQVHRSSLLVTFLPVYLFSVFNCFLALPRWSVIEPGVAEAYVPIFWAEESSAATTNQTLEFKDSVYRYVLLYSHTTILIIMRRKE